MLLFMLNIIASSFFTLLYVARIYVASYTLFILFYFFANPVLRRELRERETKDRERPPAFSFSSPRRQRMTRRSSIMGSLKRRLSASAASSSRRNSAEADKQRVSSFQFKNRKQGNLTYKNYRKVEKKISSSAGTGMVEGKLSDSYHSLYSSKIPQGISLDRVLQSPKSFKLFWDFCSAKDVAEQLKFWIEVERFQNQDWKAIQVLGLDRNEVKRARRSERGRSEEEEKQSTPRMRSRSPRSRSRSRSPDGGEFKANRIKQKAKDIWNRFLDPKNASDEVCIPGDVFCQLKNDLKGYDGDVKVFRKAQRHVFRDMEKSIFGRFVQGLDHVQLIELTHYLAVGNSSRRDKLMMQIGDPTSILKTNSNTPALATVNAILFAEE